MGLFLIVAVVLALTALVILSGVLLSRERKSRRRFRILAEVATVSDAGGALKDTMEAICDLLVPELADFCMIDLLSEGQVQRAAVRAAPDGGPEMERVLAERQPSVPTHMAEGNGRASLTPRFFERMSDQDLQELAHDPDDLEFLRRLGLRSAITVALKARGVVTGTLTLGVAWSGRRYRRDDARYAWILSGRVALALDNCGLFADLEDAERSRAQIAETLQRGLLPPPLPHVRGWSIAAMYRPAGVENEVGGDFYDVFRVPDGWMLVIGDVTGRGARAASMTAIVRYTLRTAVALDADPVVALQTVNRALLTRGNSALCSLAAVAISEDPSLPVRLAVAGHPPPLLVEGDSVDEVARADPVLGAFPEAEWRISKSAVKPGQQLVVVTDGITEARGADERFGEARLRGELRGAANPAQVLQRLERALHSFTDGRLDDDLAILAIARTPTDAPGGDLVVSPEIAMATTPSVGDG